MSPFIVLVIGVAFIIAAITILKIHPFFALLLAAVLVGMLARPDLPAEPGEEGLPRATLALEVTAREFGSLAGKIGIVIALAAVIGQCLMQSGAADKITRRLLGLMGESRANYALLGSGYILSVPVFFDTVFFLLVPLARALRLRTGRNYILYVMAICAGGVVTHSLVPPTPGPLVMLEKLDIGLHLGTAILGGFLLGLPAAFFGGILLPRWLLRFGDFPMRDAPGSSTEELEEIVSKPESELPGFWASALPVILPVVLITLHSVLDAVPRSAVEKVFADPSAFDGILGVTSFLGNKHLALGLGTAIALWVLARQKRYSLARLTASLEPALMAAGTIILITCAGGAFGAMLKLTGIGEQLQGLAGSGSGLLLLLIAWGISSVMKIAQGSGTVAMITAASIVGGILKTGVELPFHPIYVFAAIAYGSMVTSWMNDSGFWVVCKMSGFTQKETLRTWSIQLGSMGIIGLIEVLILSQILPLA